MRELRPSRATRRLRVVVMLAVLAGCGSTGTTARPTTVSAATTRASTSGSVSTESAGTVTAPATTASVPEADGLPPATASAIGAPVGAAASKTIGAAGGTVSTDDGRFTVTIPPGALTADTAVSIQPTENTAPEGLGVSYRLAPEGQVFGQPVQLALVYSDADVEGSAPEALGIAFQDAQGLWEWQSNVAVDAAAHRLTVETKHFSTWAGIPGLQLRPRAAKVKLKGQVTLYPSICTRVTGPLVVAGTCVTAPGSAGRPGTLVASSWAVNGAPRGTTGFGTVEGNSGAGVYTAPAKKPSAGKPVVAVSAQAVSASGKTVLLVSNLTIIGNGYKVSGSLVLTDTGLACGGTVTAKMTDAVDFSITSGDDGTLKVTDIKNTKTTATAPKVPVVAVAVVLVVPPELLDVTSGTVTATNTLVTVSLSGTSTVGSCTFGGQITGPPETLDAYAGTSFDPSKFVDGTQPGLPDRAQPWVWTITEQ
jgi:hypothetical protein